MHPSQFLLEDEDYAAGLFSSAALFAMSEQTNERLKSAEIVHLNPQVETQTRTADIEVLWAA